MCPTAWKHAMPGSGGMRVLVPLIVLQIVVQIVDLIVLLAMVAVEIMAIRIGTGGMVSMASS